MIKDSRTYFLFIFFFLSNSWVLAQDQYACQITKVDSFKELMERIKKNSSIPADISWWSATDKMISERKCKESAPTLEAIGNDLDIRGNTKSPTTTEDQDINFKNEAPELIEAFHNLTTQNDIFGRDISFKELQDKYKINPECQKVKCAVEKIFGKELGDKLLYINLKYGFNGSELAFNLSSRLSLEEVDSLILAIQSYPQSRFPISKNKQLTKFKRGSILYTDDSRTVAYSAIAFYDSWTKQSSSMKQYTAFHEMAHYIASEFMLNDNKVWLQISGWLQKDGKWTKKIPEAVTSEYGATKPEEDFAESVTAYRYNPVLLKKLSSEKYQFIKEVVFDGLEYLEDNQCKTAQSNILKMANYNPIKARIRTSLDLQNLISKCGKETRDYLLDNNKARPGLLTCLDHANKRTQMILNVDDVQPLLKYPQLIKNELTHQQLEVQNNNHFGPEELKESEKFIKNELITGLIAWDKEQNYDERIGEAVEQCERHWSNYSYRAIFYQNEDLAKVVEASESSEDFNVFMTKLCEKIHTGKMVLKPFTREELESALD